MGKLFSKKNYLNKLNRLLFLLLLVGVIAQINSEPLSNELSDFYEFYLKYFNDSSISFESSISINLLSGGNLTNSIGYPVSDDNLFDNLAWGVPFNYFGNYYDVLGGFHPGEDWNLTGGNPNIDNGKPVYAIADGKIAKVYDLGNLGYLVGIEHTTTPNSTFIIPAKYGTEYGQTYSYNGEKVTKIYSIYLHVSNLPSSVLYGERTSYNIKRGEILGYIMNPGGGPHLHFEIRHPNAQHSNNWTLVGNPSNWAKDSQGNNTGYYLNLQELVNAGVRDPRDFLKANNISWNFNTVYDFNDTEFWNINNLESYSVGGGIFYIDPSLSDPYIVSPPLSINYADYNTVRIRMASNAPDGIGNIYFITFDEPNWGEDKKVVFSISNHSLTTTAPYFEYIVYMGNHWKWSGTITSIRIDPSDTGVSGPNDTIGIDYIRLENISRSTPSVDLYFVPDKSSFTTGDTQEKWVNVSGGSGHSVNTYVRITKPDGTKKYAYYPSHSFQPIDSLSFSNTKRPLYNGTWVAGDSNWHWDTYTFTGSEPEGSWTWDLWYEDVNWVDSAIPPGIFASDSESYTFSAAVPEIWFSPPSMSFEAIGGGANPASQILQMKNSGDGTLSYSISDDADWLDVSPASGSSTGNTIDHTVSVDISGMSVNIYSAKITITASGATNSPQIVPVTLKINPISTPGTLSVTPTDGLSSSGPVGGPFGPTSKTYTLQNTGGSSINWTASKTQDWVSLSSTGGSLSSGASTSVTISINSNANILSIGTYTDTITFTNTTNGYGDTTRSIALTVVTQEYLSVTPEEEFSSSGAEEGPFSPSSKSYTLQNTGGGSINWTASNTKNWISLSLSSGSLSSGSSTTVTVTINSNANSLLAETYSDTVSFSNTTNGLGNTSRDVTLTVSKEIIQFIGSFDTPNYARGVEVVGSHAYIADGSSGLRIINVTDPSNPFETGYYDTPGDAKRVAISGSYAYVADYTGGLRIIDVSDPSNLFEAGFYDTPGDARDIAILDSYAYVADGYSGLRIIDVSNPASLFETGFYDTSGAAYGVAVSNQKAYIADYTEGLRIIDVSDLSNPYEVGYYVTPGVAEGVEISGSYAYLADYTSGLRIVDISNPSNPTEVGYFSSKCFSNDVCMKDSYAYLADGYSGLRIINISLPSNPSESASYDTSGYAFGVKVTNPYIYVADGLDGLIILKFTLHIVSTPNIPSGPSEGETNSSYTYTTGGSSCLQSHSVEYRFDWDDGTYSDWSNSTNASHFWSNEGNYEVKAQARCSVEHNIVSDWSSSKTVTITLQPEILHSPSSMSFKAIEGGANPTSQTLQVKNSGGGTLSYSISDDAIWLDVSPPRGSSTGSTNDHTVSVDISGISENEYNVTITITASGATNSPQTVPVTLKINPVQYNLDIETTTGGSTDPSPGSYAHDSGTEISIKAIPDSGYELSGWSGDASGTTTSVTITMDSNKSVKANFKAKEEEPFWKEYCFIATAAYGSPLHPYVKILREFRDKFLMSSKFGHVLVKFYYKYSPYIADLITKHKILKTAVWISLFPLVAFSYSMIHFGPIITAVMLAFIFILSIFPISFLLRKLRRVEAESLKAIDSMD